MNRRDFLAAGAGMAPAVWLGADAEAQSSTNVSRPNILWIMTDQQPADAMSCAGNRDLYTPAMDSLAASGMRFELSYCTNPACVPSRTSMMTGRMPHETGVTFNMNSLKIRTKSLGKRMKAAGYDTGYIGKWHIPMESTNQSWHGFDLMMEGTTEFNDQHFATPLVEFIKKPHDKPFFLVASFVNPHDICEYARKLSGFPASRSRTWNGPIPDPPPPEQCPELPVNFGIPANEPDVIRKHQNWAATGIYPVQSWAADTWRQYRWALNRLVERVDREISKVLDALYATGLDQNTIIAFVSDHGDGNGAHHWNQKTLLYDEPARVPFIISGPGVAVPGRVDARHLVSTGLDLFPTFCDYAQIDPPEGLLGRSLRPLVEGRSVDWRDDLVSECDLYYRTDQSGNVYGRMLRTARYKYVVYSSGTLREQLFDMQKDPGEMENRVMDTRYAAVLNDHRRRLAKHIKKTNDPFVVPGVAVDGWVLERSK